MAELDGRTEERLRNDLAAWLVTVSPGGQPQATPVWFLWDGETFLLYSQPGKPKLHNIAANPWVALRLDGRGNEVVTVEGTAAIGGERPADEVPDYVAKYREGMADLGYTPKGFAEDYSVPVRVVPSRWRTW